MGESSPDREIAAPLARLARTASGEFTSEEMLRELCFAGHALGIAGAGVMQVDAERVGFVHADAGFAEVERLQEQLQRGPCIDSVSQRTPVVVNHIGAEDRWPEFADASARAGIQTMVAMPLLARDCGWGVLDLYRRTATPWTAAELATTQVLADVTASYLALAADRDLAQLTLRELEHRATHDHLTGLPNRTLLIDRVEQAVVATERLGTAVAVFMLDVDRFKNVNDTLGHAAGDEVLAELAHRLKSVLREMDTLARLGGDEFVVVCEDVGGTREQVTAFVRSLDRRMRETTRRPLRVHGRDLIVTVSIGATVTSARRSVQDLLREADQAMYDAKAHGRGPLVRRRSRPPAPDLGSQSVTADTPEGAAR